MGKMLIWSRMTPLTREDTATLLLKNKINTNSGNLLFYEGVLRAVYREGMELQPFFYEDVDRLAADVDHVNSTYDGVIIPLANAFRASYTQPLRSLTRFIRAVKLPCYVIGVGMQASDFSQLEKGRSYDDVVKAFVDAVLDKSPLLGLRGEYTAQYLKNLGYLEDSHYTVIGCPSAYISGPNPPEIRLKEFDRIQKVSFHSKPELPGAMHAWISDGLKLMEKQAECVFVPQILYEFWQMYFGFRRGRRTRAGAPDYYPLSNDHPLYTGGRMLGFLSASDWIGHMRQMDFAFGSRIHGSMAAVNAGTPAVVLAADLRIRELAEYHAVPHVLPERMGELNLRAAYEQADFGAFARRYDENFRRFTAFLDRCGIDHIYRENAPERGSAPLDLAEAALDPLPVVRPGARLSLPERLRSLEMYTWLLKSKIRARKK